MKIKSKIGNHMQSISPQQWMEMEQSGVANEYEILERNTIWAEALSPKDKKPIGPKREFEMEHWENMLKQGPRLLWRRIDPPSSLSRTIETEETIQEDKDKSQILEAPELQIEIGQMELELKREQISLLKLQQSDLKNKWKYFALGLIAGLLANLPDLISFFHKL